MTFAVDHAVVNALQQMDAAVPRFRALGFTLTERGHHSLGSINHLMMFGDDYLELVGIEPGAKTVRREVADGPGGLNGLVFRTGDARRLHDELESAGIPVQPPVDFDRPVLFEGATQRAAFTTVRIAPHHLSGGRVYFCEHKTPHLVWQRQWQQHANAAVALAGFEIVVPAPADEAQRYARLLGCDTQPAGGDTVTLTLDGFRIVLRTLASYRARYGTLGCSASRTAAHETPSQRPEFMGALSIRTGSLQAVLDSLAQPEAADVQWSRDADRVTISAASACDCTIEFIQ